MTISSSVGTTSKGGKSRSCSSKKRQHIEAFEAKEGEESDVDEKLEDSMRERIQTAILNTVRARGREKSL
jgi:hypothetical protein